MSDVQKWPVYLQPVSKSIAPLPNGPGGPYDGGMEQRVKTLEENMLKTAVDLSYIKAKVEDMPSKDWITTRLVFVVGGFTGLLALIGAILKYA